jgi:DNA-directed RNA polymerase subunit delta
MAIEGKKRIVKDYDALPEEILNQVKLSYPSGFAENLVYYNNKEGKKVSALPFETDEIYYLIRMSYIEAERIIEEDDDYDDDGNLKEDFSEAMGVESASDDDDDDDSKTKKRSSYDDEPEEDAGKDAGEDDDGDDD